jgi:hypothetical protein
LADGLSVRVLILLDEAAEEISVWERTAGAWQGGELIRAPQHLGKVVQMDAPISRLRDSDLQKAPQALMRAAENARRLAEQTGTPFVSRKSATVEKKSK